MHPRYSPILYENKGNRAEIALIAPDGKQEWAAEKLTYHMKAAATQYIKNVPIVADVKISKNWDH